MNKLIKLLFLNTACVALFFTFTNIHAESGNLIEAAEQGDLPRVKALLNAKADVNAKKSDDGVTALMLAAQDGHKEVVQGLLNAKADVNAKENNGKTALQIAIEENENDVARLLRNR